jgi:predicted secreted protein
MARTHGKDLNFSYNTVALEGELNSATISFTIPSADITSFADAWQNFLAGKKTTVTEISGTLNMAAGGGDVTLFEGFGSGVKTTILDPTGSGPNTNDPEYQCTASGLTGVLVATYNISLPVGGAATFTATLQHSGSTTRAVS